MFITGDLAQEAEAATVLVVPTEDRRRHAKGEFLDHANEDPVHGEDPGIEVAFAEGPRYEREVDKENQARVHRNETIEEIIETT